MFSFFTQSSKLIMLNTIHVLDQRQYVHIEEWQLYSLSYSASYGQHGKQRDLMHGRMDKPQLDNI